MTQMFAFGSTQDLLVVHLRIKTWLSQILSLRKAKAVSVDMRNLSSSLPYVH